MSVSDPKLATEMALRDRQMSALRATFLIAAHHDVALRPEDLPRLIEGDIAPSITASLTAAGFRVKLGGVAPEPKLQASAPLIPRWWAAKMARG